MTAFERLKNAQTVDGTNAVRTSSANAFDRLRNAQTVDDGVQITRPTQEALDKAAKARAEALAKEAAEEAASRTFADRVKDTFSGWKDRTAASYAGAAENLLEITRALDSKNSLQSKQAAQAEKNASHYREMLERGTWDNGKAITAEERKWINEQIKDAEKDSDIYRKGNEAIHKPVSNVISNVESYGDRKQAESEKSIARAKEGASAVGKVAIDLGMIAGDVAADALANTILPGSATLTRGARMFGEGAEAAEDKGYGLGKQFAYGASKAALGEATSRVFNSNPILQKAFGKGALDDIILPGLNATKGGRIVKGGLGEMFEETVEGVGDIGLQALLFGENRDKVTGKDIAYDALLAAIFGSATSAISPNPNKGLQEASGSLAASSKGVDASAKNVPQEASAKPSETVMSSEAQRLFSKENPVANRTVENRADKLYKSLEGLKRNQRKTVNGYSVGVYTRNGSDDITVSIKKPNGEIIKDSIVGGKYKTNSQLQYEIAYRIAEMESTKHGAVGAAAYNFQTPDSVSEEKTSRVADTSMRYNSTEQEATGLDAEQYEKLLKYKTLTEKMATQQADDMLYVEQDGQRKFIRDVDEAAYQDIANWLKMAPAWDAPMTDTAHMIRNELKSRAVNGEISHEEYVAWLESMREHATASGQGVQAHAKWSRTDNRGGATTELEAKRALEKSKLPPEEQARIFSQIVQWDSEIEAVEPGDTASLKAIIMKAANERGVVGGLFGNFFASRAESALDVLTFDQLKQFAYSSTAALANDSTPANAGQKVKAIQVLNMLSKPTTFSKNITGNTTFYGLDAAAMNGASLIDMAVSKMTGTRSIAMEGLPDMRAAVKAMQMAIAEITLDIDMGSETSRYGTGSSRTFKMGGTGVLNTNTSVDKFVERIISSLERNQAYLLNATDEFYKGAARATESKTQKLIDSGKIKTSDKEYAKKQADNLAKVRTFQDNSKVSAAIQTIHDVLNLIGVGDSGKKVKGITVHSFGLGDIVAPFTKIAGNLVSRGIEYSPLNAAKGTLEIVKQVVAAGQGNVDAAKQAQGVSDLARGMTGTAIAYGFMQLVKAGLMRQADDEGDKGVAALNQSEGVHGTQLNISATERALNGESAEWRYGDTLIDLSSIEPLNLLMNLGAEMAKEQKNPLISSFGATVTSAGKAAAELPVLENVGDFVKDVAVYKRDWKEALGEMAANTAISSVVPNVVSGIAAGMDDRPRNVYTGDNLWDYIQDSFKNKIPGLRETLPASTNSLGEEKTYQGSQDSLLASLLSPVGINTYAQGSVSAEMERVREATGGDVSFYPESTIPKKLSFDNKEVALTYDQRQKYQNVRGNTQTRVTDAMMKTQAYKKASAEDQAALLNRCKSYAQQTAKASILGEKSVDKWVLNAKSAERDLKMSTVDYISLYEKYGHEYLSGKAYEKTKQVAQAGFDVEEYIKARTGMDADDNDRLSKKEARNRLREVGYTEKEIPILMEIINKTW